ncbi:hypothetical protein M378DRAFT_8282 [Amanita muscaria Koide BX008]|uniref:Gelsolin n=1 Tax=Amanita muscaria (strain Koide BX008) TaxID=946122 RepID=A0A0C2XHD5_AMAMK|nr:hypothetical protein M378DRAFT_8282 [Amanita muscaria Koide BX008]
MDTLSSNSHTRHYDIPKSEEDLAEWTTRIKALQRQVDADDEAEQRSLEEEIAAARRARLRRSRDMKDYSSSPSRSDHSQTNVEKQTETSKRALNVGYNGQGAAFDAEKKSVSQTLPVRKAEPMSLAAFIGGRATGPRLNKHAPQQDATDPTQFEQRTHTTVPHPVFGRNGIAMPGLVGQRPSEVRSLEAGGFPPASIEHKPHVPLPVKKHAEQSGERPIGSKRTGDKENKENRVSQKASEKKVAFASRTGDEENGSVMHKASVREPVFFPSMAGEQEQTIPPQRTSSRERAISTPVGFAAVQGAVRLSSRAPERRDTHHDIQVGIPLKDRFKQLSSQAEATTRRASTASPTPQKLPPTSSYLARPIQPQPRPLSQPAMAPPYSVPSPAFAKPPAQKEVTPSISRLQGRGFVKSIVKISSQLESPSVTPPSPPTKPLAGRKSSVLDRWQPQVAASSSTPPPPVAPKPVTLVKALPSNPSPFDTRPPSRPPSISPVKRLRTRASLPSISQGITDGAKFDKNTKPLEKMPPDGTPGLGSATTMAIYKPSASPIESEFMHVDELGIRMQIVSPCTEDAGKIHASGGLPPPSRKPLSHPTKDRARKTRKVKDVQGTGQERDKEAVVEHAQDRASLATPSTLPISVQQDVPTLNAPDIPPEHPGIAVNPSGTGRSPTLGNVASRWTEQTLITVSPASPPTALQNENKRAAHLGRALPGMAPRHNTMEPAAVLSRPKSSSSMPRNREGATGQPANVAVRHARSPSTERRPTVMDVALALSQQAEIQSGPLHVQEGKDQNFAATQIITHEMKGERRKSTLNKYTSIVLPSVKEEGTPSSTPNSTLSRHTHPSNNVDVLDMKKTVETFTRLQTSHTDNPLPIVDVPRLLKHQPKPEFSEPTVQTISVDVLSIMGLTTIPVLQNSNIFYDTELLAIVYRSKSRVDGLVSTALWVWRGKHIQVGDKEQRKIQDLSRHYGTNAILIKQHSEPPKLVHLLGGVLAIRQGSRSRWSSENTTMHLIRENGGAIYIDEFDLSAKKLCSGFSYCISILNTIYVWYGRGSTQAERQAALQYARSCSLEGQQPLELHEGEDDIDEMFWMLLGGQDYAKADYWKWRKEAPVTDPVIWRVRAEQGDQAVRFLLNRKDEFDVLQQVIPISSWSSESNFQEGVYILNCVWEFFVLVGSRARSRKQDIRLSLDVAQTMAKTLAPHRPFLPTVHTLVLPSQLPLDMRLNFRDLDEESLNDGEVPDHMNIFSVAEALDSLQKRHGM